MVKKDFRTFEQYKKELTEPKPEPKPALELKPVTNKKKEKEDEREPIVVDDEYEYYKYDWLAENGFTIYDLIEAIVSYAVGSGATEELIRDPIGLTTEWENYGGFGDQIYPDYDEWLSCYVDEGEAETVKDKPDRMETIADIIAYLDAGYTPDELETMGYSGSDVEFAVQYQSSVLF